MPNLAQTFFVSATAFPNGVFVPSIDVCFKSVPSTTSLPVTVQIRPTDNGTPSNSVVLPFAEASLVPTEITTTDTPDLTTSANFTRFAFASPVYLAPGEYAIVIIANDPEYEVYTALLGDTVLGTTRIVSEQPYSGSFFKSSNASTYTPIQNEDMMFRVNRCVFATNTPGTATFVNRVPTANVNLDTEFLQSQQIIYGPGVLQWGQKTTPNTSLVIDGSYTRVEPNKNVFMNDGSGRRVILASPSGDNGKYYAQATFQTGDNAVSPILDGSRLSLIAIENSINNDSSNETGTFGGNALFRYISRRVTLIEGFDSNSIQVYITAYMPQNTSIKVYVKILNREDPDTFDAKSWIPLVQTTSSNLYSNDPSVTYEYNFAKSASDDTLSYTSNGVTYTSFATYAIKIVGLSSDTTIVPRLQDMRAIALPA